MTEAVKPGRGENLTRVRVRPCPARFGCAPAADEVLAWVVDLACPPVHPDELFARLTADEQARARRYLSAQSRHQFAVGRGLLRGLLAECFGVPPADVPLCYLPSGKPLLADGLADLHFNVTHTDGVLVLAAARRRVGVDVEVVRPVRDMGGLVRRYFSPAEAAAFAGLPDERKQAGFFRGWTTKEAVIKAAGATVACLAEFDVELDPRRPARVNAVRTDLLGGAEWALAEWTAPGGVAVALALEGEGAVEVETGASE